MFERKKQKNIFTERRMVFKVPERPESLPATEEPFFLSEEMKKVRESTASELDALKVGLSLNDLKNTLDVSDLSVDGVLDVSGTEINFESQFDKIQSRLNPLLAAKQPEIDRLAEKIDEDEEDLRWALEGLLPASAVAEMEMSFNRKFPKYAEFVGQGGASINQYKVKGGEFLAFDVTFGPEAAVKAYEEFVKGETEKESEKPSEEAPADPKETAKKLAETGMGTLLLATGIFKEQDLEDVATGKNLFGVILFSLAGHKNLLGNVGEVYTKFWSKIKSVVPKKYRRAVEKVEKKTKELIDKVSGGEEAAEAVEPSFQEVDADFFGKMATGELPAVKDFEVKDDYLFENGNDKLKVKLGEGEKVVVPEGVEDFIYLDAGTAKSVKGPAEFTGEVVIVGKVPKGLQFVGEPEFALEESE